MVLRRKVEKNLKGKKKNDNRSNNNVIMKIILFTEHGYLKFKINYSTVLYFQWVFNTRYQIAQGFTNP